MTTQTTKTNQVKYNEVHQFKTYSPLDYLMIDIATNYGDAPIGENGEMIDLDKVSFEERIEWFKGHEKAETLVDMIESADKPALYYAGLRAYDDTMMGKPTGYPVSLDACSSGLQLLSILSNCAKSASRCGVLNTGRREDAYSSLYADMKLQSANIPNMRLDATRSDLKQAVMTSLYGSKVRPRKLFGKDTPALKLYYDIIEEEIPGAWELNLALKSLWQSYAESHEWIMPDNFHVSMRVEGPATDEVVFLGSAVEVYTKQAQGTPTGLSLSPNIVHSIDGMIVREISRRCQHDENQVKRVKELCKHSLRRKCTPALRKTISGRGRSKDKELKTLWSRFLKTHFLSARVIDLIDEHNIGIVSAALVQDMLYTLPKKSFPVLAIHDCFRIHPNYANDLRKQYNEILSCLAASDILSDIATQITGTRMRLKKVGDIASDILDANYALS